MNKVKTIDRNSEILFIYDAKMTNPNGDMDNENKPRMDYDTNTNLVSDVRLKRYLRNYFEDILKKDVFVTEKAENAEKHVISIIGRKPTKNNPLSLKELAQVRDSCFDIRFFGAVFGTEGGNDHLTGPIQFNWGYSLNTVELNESFTITSTFSSGEGIGKDFRVKYSLIAFNGSINSNIAKYTKLTPDLVGLFDKAMVKAIPFNRTRSKTGQAPRLYIRAETENTCFLKDLREYINLQYKTDDFKVRSVSDYKLDLSKLKSYLTSKKDEIKNIFYWVDDKLEITKCDNLSDYLDINGITVEKIDISPSQK
ncbi:MAG: type I-B CRISPR-associated protein Cas7/Csh2 [Atribacterota bacterium]